MPIIAEVMPCGQKTGYLSDHFSVEKKKTKTPWVTVERRWGPGLESVERPSKEITE